MLLHTHQHQEGLLGRHEVNTSKFVFPNLQKALSLSLRSLSELLFDNQEPQPALMK